MIASSEGSRVDTKAVRALREKRPNSAGQLRTILILFTVHITACWKEWPRQGEQDRMEPQPSYKEPKERCPISETHCMDGSSSRETVRYNVRLLEQNLPHVCYRHSILKVKTCYGIETNCFGTDRIRCRNTATRQQLVLPERYKQHMKELDCEIGHRGVDSTMSLVRDRFYCQKWCWYFELQLF